MAKDNHLYMKPTQEGLDKIAQLRAKVIELDDLIDELMLGGYSSTDDHAPCARSIALAKTKLEECRMRAIEAIVRKHNAGVA
jgi:hypothetical protein